LCWSLVNPALLLVFAVTDWTGPRLLPCREPSNWIAVNLRGDLPLLFASKPRSPPISFIAHLVGVASGR